MKPYDLTTYDGRKSFYHTREWKDLRKYKLSLNPLCERCLSKGIIRKAVDIHHIQDISSHPHLALSYTNLQALCKPCHSSLPSNHGCPPA